MIALASPVWAEPSATVVSSTAQIREMCQHLVPAESLQLTGNAFERGQKRAAHRQAREVALSELYVVEMQATEFELLEYDVDNEELEINSGSGIRVAGGVTTLNFAPGDPMRVSLPPNEARQIARLHQQRQLRLRFGFFLRIESASASPCSYARYGQRVMSIQADLAFFELRRNTGQTLIREELAELEDDESDSSEGEASTASGPAVTLTRASVSGQSNLGRLLETDTGRQLGRRYLSCYQQRLETRSDLSGTVVVNFTVARGGTVTSAHLEIDSLGDRQLGACVLNQTRGFNFPNEAWGNASLPINFTNED